MEVTFFVERVIGVKFGGECVNVFEKSRFRVMGEAEWIAWV